MLASNAGGLINELEEAVHSGASTRRVDMLRRVTDLFFAQAPVLNEQQTAVFDDVIERLADKVEVRVRSELAERLSISGDAPINITRKLARDEIAVARSILANSIRLDDDDLADIASQAGQEHLLAISERGALSEQITDVLITRGDQKVMHTLAGNDGARFSGYGFKTLVDRADGDEALQEKIGSRRDLPQPLLKSLMLVASERVRRRLIANGPQSNNLDGRCGESGHAPVDYAIVEAEIDQMQRSGELNEQGVLHLLVARQERHVIVALARLAGLPPSMVQTLWAPEQQSDGLLIVTRAVGLSPKTVREIIKLASGDLTAPETLDETMRNFARLSVATAQRVVRFWKVRTTTQGDGESIARTPHLVHA